MKDYEDITASNEEAKEEWARVKKMLKISNVQLPQNSNILDIGGGVGRFSKIINQEAQHNAYSLDIQNTGAEKSANPLIADASNLPFPDDTFNLVHSRGIFDQKLYKSNMQQLVSEVHRVLKTGGVLSVNDSDHPDDSFFEPFFTRVSNPTYEYSSLWRKKERVTAEELTQRLRKD